MEKEKIVTTQEYINIQLTALKDLMAERDKRYQDRFEAQEKALMHADDSLREYKVQANEWRAQSKDLQNTINSLSFASSESRGKSAGISATWATVISVLSLIFGAIAVKLLHIV